MNFANLAIAIVILVLVVLAVRYALRHPGCGGNCAKCKGSCCGKNTTASK